MLAIVNKIELERSTASSYRAFLTSHMIQVLQELIVGCIEITTKQPNYCTDIHKTTDSTRNPYSSVTFMKSVDYSDETALRFYRLYGHTKLSCYDWDRAVSQFLRCFYIEQ